MKKIEKIIVVGGGSAGWMTASVLIKAFPSKQITVIESPKFPTIGVGESTLVAIRNFAKFLEIEEKEFMSFTDASYKFSIKFTDFLKKDGGSFYYSFGIPELEFSYQGIRDWLWKKSLYQNTDNKEYIRWYFPQAALFEQNKFSINADGQFSNFNPDNDLAYHFDATKFGLWLKEKYCLPRGVNLISDTIIDVVVGEQGVDHLVLESNSNETADLYIDCSGFRSILLEQAMQVPFESYSHILPNNKAWACQLPYIDKESEIEGFTHCTAIENGWCWNTPLWSRLGTGYVFSDEFVSEEQALDEFKNYLCSDKMRIPRNRSQLENLNFRLVPFKVGIHEKLWVKNVVAIGLSAGFIEPLESNGLYSVHEFLFKLLKCLQRPRYTQWDRDVFNTACKGMFKNFAEFVALHYALTLRDDTEYWKNCTNKVYDSNMINLEPTTSVGFHDLQIRKMFTADPGDFHNGIPWISVGMDFTVFDRVDQMLHEFTDKMDHKTAFAPLFRQYEKRAETWWKAAEQQPSLYEYLKTNIYDDHD